MSNSPYWNLHVTLVGSRPLLQQSPYLMIQESALPPKLRQRGVQEMSAAEEARLRLYPLPDGSGYGMPGRAIWRAMWDAASNMKLGQRSARVVLRAAMRVEPDLVPLVHPETGELLRDWVVDVRRVVIQGSAVARARPMWPTWAVRATLRCYRDVLPPSSVDSLVQLLIRAGRTQGLGDFRPYYGTFELASYEVSDA